MLPNDILGLGKVLPLDKLLEVVSKAVGRVSKSYFDKKDIDTRVYEINKITEAKVNSMKTIAVAMNETAKLTGGIEYKDDQFVINSPQLDDQSYHNNLEIAERADERIKHQSAIRQNNIEIITSFAAEELKQDEPVTNEPLDDDWISRFFKIAEDISSEDMQAIWGKILAGEIKEPKTYSLRTLEVIRNLSREEADRFTYIAKFAIHSGKDIFLFKGEDTVLPQYGISYDDIALFTEIGLIQPGSFVTYQLMQQPIDAQTVFSAGNTIIIANIKANTPTINIPINLFTKSGNQLLNLITNIPPFDYLQLFANSIKSEYVNVKHGAILEKVPEGIRHTHPLQEF